MAEEICGSLGCQDFRPGLARKERDNILSARYELAEMIMRAHPGCSQMVIDVAVPISAYPDIIAMAKSHLQEAGIAGYIFSHAGDGNLHLVFMGKDGDEEEWRTIEQVNENMVKSALAAGGTATGEHGVGIGKRKFMEAEHGIGMELMKKFKFLLDPKGILNPGKLIP